MEKFIFALVITQRGHLQNGLQSLLRTIPKIKVIAESQDPSILSTIGEEIHPDLIVIEACLIEDSDWAVLSKLKVDWPRIKILVLSDDDIQGKRSKEAGADFSLPKGFPAADLVNLIEGSLIRELLNNPNLEGRKNESE